MLIDRAPIGSETFAGDRTSPANRSSDSRTFTLTGCEAAAERATSQMGDNLLGDRIGLAFERVAGTADLKRGLSTQNSERRLVADQPLETQEFL